MLKKFLRILGGAQRSENTVVRDSALQGTYPTGRGAVPEFKVYYASPDMMNRKQMAFYEYLVKEIKSGRYPSVEGNISYLFAYLYPLIGRWTDKGLMYVYEMLIELAEAYHEEETFALYYCRDWAYDCLLGLNKFDLYLELTEPEELLPSDAFYSNERSNILYYLGRPAQTKDVLALFGWKQAARLTKYARDNLELFTEFVDRLFTEEAQKKGPWLERILSAQRKPEAKKKQLFQSVPIDSVPIMDFGFYDFRRGKGYSTYVNMIARRMRIAENQLREAQGLPSIGEGWLSETALYHSIRKAFPETQVIQHGAPGWLGRQHLDIYLPRWRIAVEYHGEQHFRPVEIFGGEEGFRNTRERDTRKGKLCASNNVKLLIATSNDSHEEIIARVRQARYGRTGIGK